VDANAPPSTGETAKPPIPAPKGVWGAILTMTPIVLTVLATAFAGLSTSEMTQAMYYRSLAAQNQSKAGDQWAFFQAKRMRGTTMETTVDLFEGLGQSQPFEPAEMDAALARILQSLEKSSSDGDSSRLAAGKAKSAREKLAALLADSKTRQLLPYLTGPELPKINVAISKLTVADTSVDAALEAIAKRLPDADIADVVAKLREDEINNAQRLAQDNVEAFNKACEPVANLIKQFRASLGELGTALRSLRNGAEVNPAVAQFDRLNSSIKAAGLEFDARRYRQEATWNRKVAEILEVRVRRAEAESDRHRRRSYQFFYSMLVAQAGVTIASLALARQHRSVLWVFATIAGLVSLGFTAWVYLTF